MYMYIYMYVFMYMYIYMYVFMYVCMYVCADKIPIIIMAANRHLKLKLLKKITMPKMI